MSAASQEGTGGEQGKIGVFLVDDHEVLRRGQRDLLEAGQTSRWSGRQARRSRR